jgi:hypothetical protein
MNRSTVPVLSVIVLLLLILIGYRYNNYILHKDFIIDATAPCITGGTCFMADCAPGDASCDPTPYVKVSLPAAEAPECLVNNDCDQFSCEGLQGCQIIYCSQDVLDDGETCADGTPTSTSS